MNATTATDLSTAMLLELHHRRLDEMLVATELLVDAENWNDAKLRFDDFRRELEEHIRLEEEVMFPAFEARGPSGPTAVMRAEHLSIRQLLASVGSALSEERPISRATADLTSQLAAHNFKEENVLYPAFERLAPPATKTTLGEKVQALLRERA
jgi:iron-sulfur cluster repair protein YtfE (RIC family)